MDDNELNLYIKLFKKSGDKIYFEKIYHHFLSSIYRFVFFQISNKQTAEDLTSEVFIKVYNNLRNSNLNSATFKSWLYKIAQNTITDYFRKENKNKYNISFEQYTEAVNEDDLRDKNLIKEEKFLENEFQFENEKLINLLNKLPDEQKKILLLKYIEELDYKTISSILNKNQSALRTMNFRTLKYIKEELNK
ncbi:MAG: RNA polymerase sigma factor [Actinobacteria bacterium]|nr:RNA polymerase sigma factor [Cyanobacteriota bacterium]MCL5772495.1 RNA polymerase sigma factor [Actinomycetota bacterium]